LNAGFIVFKCFLALIKMRSDIIDNNTLKVEVKPYEIKTLRVKPSTTVQGKLAQE